MNNNTRGIEVNHINETITMTKKFYKAACTLGSDEYEMFMKAKKECLGYSIEVKEIEKKVGKVSYAGLTIYKMQAAVQFIAGEEKAEFFQKQTKVYEGEKGKYATVKKIFLNTYKDAYQNLTVDEMVEVDRLAKEIKENAMKATKSAEIVNLPEATAELKKAM